MVPESNPDSAETVCCICDDGGNVTYCDGRCLRLFHLSKGDTLCPTLGLSKAEVEHMDKFYCPNCTLNIHQCYACGRLGRSDGDAQQVFLCKTDMCGHFYHASCAAKLILKVDDNTSGAYAAMVESIEAGSVGFSCPRHNCRKCGGEENENIYDLQFGLCRRCPRVWHRKCLPRSIVRPEVDEPQRAWNDLLPDRILVYCQRHAIIPELGTPARNHVKFPGGLKLKSKAASGEEVSTLTKVSLEALKPTSQKNVVKSKAERGEKENALVKLIALKKRGRAYLENVAMASGQKSTKLLKHISGERMDPSISLGKCMPALCGLLSKKLDRHALRRLDSASPKVSKLKPPAVFMIKRNVGSSFAKEDVCNTKENAVRGSKHKITFSTKGASIPDVKLRTSSMIFKSQKSAPHRLPQKSDFLGGKAAILGNEARSMVCGIIERVKASISLEDVTKKHVVPACYKRNTSNLDKKYGMVKIESIAKGVRKALEVMERGGTVEDAKAICSPEFIDCLQVCQKDLNIYLCPFLHGSRYTSYGRHFTLPVKLAEIVERLHWYIDEGDMMVDFCCGYNHFSLMMKQKLEQIGKTCEYKNFDLIQTKHDFKFTKGDWFDVKHEQFPDGNRLIMGLNPPFSLANQFVRHALTFKPKLLVLIVPKETERPGQRHGPYDLIWEDKDLLYGKSFHLPGSVDVDDQTLEDWNKNAPYLYIWSRPDQTFRHQGIALNKGHVRFGSNPSYVGNPLHETSLQIPSISDFALEENVESTSDDMIILDQNKSNSDTVDATLDGNEDNITLMSERNTEPILENAKADGNQGNSLIMEGRNVEVPDVVSADVLTHLPQKDGLPKAMFFEGCSNLRSEEFENAKSTLEESSKKARPIFRSDYAVCRQEKVNNGAEERQVFTDEINQPKGTSKEHLTSMEIFNGEREPPIKQYASGRKLPNDYHGQMEASTRFSPSVIAMEHPRGSLGKLFDRSLPKKVDGCERAFVHSKQVSEHPNKAHLKSGANPSSKTLYYPEGHLNVWKQDTQDCQMSRSYGDTIFTSYTHLAEEAGLPKAIFFEGRDNLRSEEFENARQTLEESSDKIFGSDYAVCGQEKKVNDGVEEPQGLAYQNDQPKRISKEHLTSMEIIDGEREPPIRQDACARQLSNDYRGQMEASARSSSSVITKEHLTGSLGKLIDSSQPKKVDGCERAFEHSKHVHEHPNKAHLKSGANPSSRTLYRPELHLNVWKQDTQDCQMSRGYGDTFFTTQKRHTQYNRPEAPRPMFGLNGSGGYGMQGLLGPRGGAFPQSGLLKPPQTGLQPPHNGLRHVHNYSTGDWTGIVRQGVAPVRCSAFGSFGPQFQAPLGLLHDPSGLSSQNLLVGGHVGPLQGSVLGCPPSQRPPGQAYRHAF